MVLFFRSGEDFFVFLRFAPPKLLNSLVPRPNRRDFMAALHQEKLRNYSESLQNKTIYHAE